jgi:hypothetical protein
MQSLRFHRLQNVNYGLTLHAVGLQATKIALAFARDRQVWVSEALGNGARHLTFEATSEPSDFSPDGRAVAHADRKAYGDLNASN